MNGTLLRRSYLTHTGDGHYKFYLLTIRRDGADYTTEAQFGKIGSQGQVHVKYSGTSEPAAIAALERFEREKLDKGYQPTQVTPETEALYDVGMWTYPDCVSPTRASAALADGSPAVDPAYAAQAFPTGRRAYAILGDGAVSFLDPAAARPMALDRSVMTLIGATVLPDELSDTVADVEIVGGTAGTWAPAAATSTVIVLDLLRYNGEDLTPYPLHERLLLAEQLVDELSLAGTTDWDVAPLYPLGAHPAPGYPAQIGARDPNAPHGADGWVVAA